MATPAQGEKIVIDGSTGLTPLALALAKAYAVQNPAAVAEIGKGLGPKARIQALAGGTIVQSDKYVLTRDSFLVTRAAASSNVARFLEFIRAPAGERVVAANGAVPAK